MINHARLYRRFTWLEVTVAKTLEDQNHTAHTKAARSLQQIANGTLNYNQAVHPKN